MQQVMVVGWFVLSSLAVSPAMLWLNYAGREEIWKPVQLYSLQILGWFKLTLKNLLEQKLGCVRSQEQHFRVSAYLPEVTKGWAGFGLSPRPMSPSAALAVAAQALPSQESGTPYLRCRTGSGWPPSSPPSHSLCTSQKQRARIAAKGEGSRWSHSLFQPQWTQWLREAVLAGPKRRGRPRLRPPAPRGWQPLTSGKEPLAYTISRDVFPQPPSPTITTFTSFLPDGAAAGPRGCSAAPSGTAPLAASMERERSGPAEGAAAGTRLRSPCAPGAGRAARAPPGIGRAAASGAAGPRPGSPGHWGSLSRSRGLIAGPRPPAGCGCSGSRREGPSGPPGLLRPPVPPGSPRGSIPRDHRAESLCPSTHTRHPHLFIYSFPGHLVPQGASPAPHWVPPSGRRWGGAEAQPRCVSRAGRGRARWGQGETPEAPPERNLGAGTASDSPLVFHWFIAWERTDSSACHLLTIQGELQWK